MAVKAFLKRFEVFWEFVPDILWKKIFVNSSTHTKPVWRFVTWVIVSLLYWLHVYLTDWIFWFHAQIQSSLLQCGQKTLQIIWKLWMSEGESAETVYGSVRLFCGTPFCSQYLPHYGKHVKWLHIIIFESNTTCNWVKALFDWSAFQGGQETILLLKIFKNVLSF